MDKGVRPGSERRPRQACKLDDQFFAVAGHAAAPFGYSRFQAPIPLRLLPNMPLDMPPSPSASLAYERRARYRLLEALPIGAGSVRAGDLRDAFDYSAQTRNRA